MAIPNTSPVALPITLFAIRHVRSFWERKRLQAIPHSPESMDGIPYYDEEFKMAQSDPHRHVIYRLGTLLDDVAKLAGLRGVSDYPIWYWISEENRQKELYPDYALSSNPEIVALRSSDLRLVLEVVSTAKAAKERKDTVRMKNYNADNGVPEFALLYPELDDMRSLEWFRLDAAGNYQPVALPADRRYRSVSVPGLELEVLNTSDWRLGRKVRVWYRGEALYEREEERQARVTAEHVAEQERQARATAEDGERQARTIAEHMVEQERQARTIAEHVAEQERQARISAEHVAEQERQARAVAEQAAQQAEARLRELLKLHNHA